MTGLSLVLLSSSITLSAPENASFPNEIRVAQAQFTIDQIPPTDQLSNSSELQYGDRVNSALNVSSIRHQGRRFAAYHLKGEAEQLIRIN